MLNINTNLSSLIVQSNLKTSTNQLNQAIERMTTGFKINHAKDNAANYSININLSTKISAYNIAEDNAMMGLDMVSTASSSLDGISNLLSRLRCLSIQAQNRTYGNSSLSALNSEAGALVSEISRIRTNTKYNGIELLAPKAQEPEAPYTYTPNADGFLIDVVKRDTSASVMTTLASVDETAALTTGTYSISTAEELAKLATMTNKGLIGKDTEFVLANDIDLSAYSTGSGWTPIGDKYENYFEGDFDGNGYTIKNLYINNPSDTYAGLFGYLGSNSSVDTSQTIKNVGIINADVTSGSRVREDVGILAGMCNVGIINNCYATGKITIQEFQYAGGLIGWFQGPMMEDCWTDVRIVGTGIQTDQNLVGALGGIVSLLNGGVIQRCFSLGDVYAPGLNNVGGIVGDANGKICDSYSTGNMTGGMCVGGIVGDGSKMSNCYSTGNVSGTSFVGGLGGYSSSTASILNSNFYGTVSGVEPLYVGALYGRMLDKYCVTIGENTTCYPLDCTIEGCSYIGNGLSAVGTGTYNGSNNIDLSAEIAMTEKVLQIGINSTEASTLQFSTGFAFNGLDTLLALGLENPLTLEKIDDLIANVNVKQTELGAVENRLMSALEQINVSYDNLVSTQSTIRDADIAEESSEYIRNQILQQASATLLATANQTPSIALQLL